MIVWCLLQFYIVFLTLYYIAALVSGAEIRNIGLDKQISIAVPAVFYNVLYLTAYGSVVLMIGFIVRKTTVATIFTFVLVFGDLLVSGYLKDSPQPLLKAISDNSLMTHIFKFSGIYSQNSKRVLLSGANDHIITAVIPIAVIAASILIVLLVFNKRDIQTNS